MLDFFCSKLEKTWCAGVSDFEAMGQQRHKFNYLKAKSEGLLDPGVNISHPRMLWEAEINNYEGRVHPQNSLNTVKANVFLCFGALLCAFLQQSAEMPRQVRKSPVLDEFYARSI